MRKPPQGPYTENTAGYEFGEREYYRRLNRAIAQGTVREWPGEPIGTENRAKVTFSRRACTREEQRRKAMPRKLEAYRMYQRGMKYADIAAHFGVSPSHARQLAVSGELLLKTTPSEPLTTWVEPDDQVLSAPLEKNLGGKSK